MSRTIEIEEYRRKRWERGVAEHRDSPEQPFQGNPLVEALQEAIDGLSYSYVLLDWLDKKELSEAEIRRKDGPPMVVKRWQVLTLLNLFREASFIAHAMVYPDQDPHDPMTPSTPRDAA